MGMIDVARDRFPDVPSGILAGTPQTIDAASEVAGYVMYPSRAGNVTHIRFKTQTVTSGATVDARIEGVNTSGQPSGSLLGTNSNGAQVIANADDNTWFRTALTTPVAISPGTPIGVLIANPAASFGNLQIVTWMTWGGTRGFPTPINPTRTTKVDNNVFPALILELADGTYDCPTFPWENSNTTITLDTVTNPDEVALRLNPKGKRRACGWWAYVRLAAGSDFKMNLYDINSDTPLISTASHDGDFSSTTGAVRYIERPFDNGDTAVISSDVRLGIVPLTANDVILQYVDVLDAAMFDIFSGGRTAYWEQRNRSGTSDPDAAAWTATLTRRPLMGLLYDQLADGGALGRGIGRGM
jgi:hypothetical protein